MQIGGLVGSVTYAGDWEGVPAIRRVGCVPARRQKRDIWIGEVSGWIKYGGEKDRIVEVNYGILVNPICSKWWSKAKTS